MNNSGRQDAEKARQQGEGMAWLVPRAHGTPTMRGMEPDDLLCSRNARPQKEWEGGGQVPFLLAERAG